MTHAFDVPKIMAHLKTDDRGYPIPYFVPIVNGKPEFRYQDIFKREACLKRKLCSICGKKLFKKSYWFISGPWGLKNKTASDAPMHEDCARFSIATCPHLIYQKADRRTDIPADSPLIAEKPDIIFLIKADKYEAKKTEKHKIIFFRPVYVEDYYYAKNKLVKAKPYETILR